MAYLSPSFPDTSSRRRARDHYPPATTTQAFEATIDNPTHAPRRMQHSYSSETGPSIEDIGAYRRGVVRFPSSSDPSPPATAPPRHLDYHYQHPASSYLPQQSDRHHPQQASVASWSEQAFVPTRDFQLFPDPSPTPRSSKDHRRASKSSSMALQPPAEVSTLLTPPRTPNIKRLATPDLAPLSAGLRFCPCCSGEEDHVHEGEYLKGRKKMDHQLQSAMEHISRTSRRGNERLPPMWD